MVLNSQTGPYRTDLNKIRYDEYRGPLDLKYTLELGQSPKPNVTQLNSTQLKATQKQLRWVRHSSHLEPTTAHTQTFHSLLDQLGS